MATIRDEDVDHLVCMGFPHIEVRNALQLTGGNLENAVNHLLSGGGGGCSGGGGGSSGLTASVPTTHQISSANNNNNNNNNNNSSSGINSGVHVVVEGTTSQYTYSSDGRSACTCIALTVADMILNNDMTTTSSGEDDNSNDIITTDFLDHAIAEGVSRYRRLVSSSSSSEVEHLSAEEVLRKDTGQARTNDDITDTNNKANNKANNANDSSTTKQRIFDVEVNVHGGIRQGALSLDINHPLGMKPCLEGLVRDIRASNSNSNSDSRMICVLLTKTPETVMLCIPTNDDVVVATTTNSTHQKYYWLIDSHPRPQLLPGVETCYAKSHLTMDSLLQSLRDVFPFTDLGRDVQPMMADMYNMYDLYPLEGRRRR
jgi:hypothetical protein